ncbi:hypothetical protein MF545_19020, partial [Stenotrophomonas maltophilia]|nr:hypothetical protein [Stenotrophomonas maltophilia]
MAPTVLRSPSRPASHSFLRVPATERNQKIKSKSGSLRFEPSMARLYTNNSIISTLSTHGVDLPTDRRKLSKAGW